MCCRDGMGGVCPATRIPGCIAHLQDALERYVLTVEYPDVSATSGTSPRRHKTCEAAGAVTRQEVEAPLADYFVATA